MKLATFGTQQAFKEQFDIERISQEAIMNKLPEIEKPDNFGSQNLDNKSFDHNKPHDVYKN